MQNGIMLAVGSVLIFPGLELPFDAATTTAGAASIAILMAYRLVRRIF